MKKSFGVLLALFLLAGCGAGAGGCGFVYSPQEPAPDMPQGSGGTNWEGHRDKPHVVLVSLDGFKPEYLERFALPNLRRIVERGTRAERMLPVFPSLTFPNHFSLVTGVNPETHGIVANSFWDPERKQAYSLGTPEAVGDGSWYLAEPIWVTAERQGMVAACFFWPGSEAPIRPTGAAADVPGIRPTIWNRYDGKVPNDERVRTVLEWLSRPEDTRPHMITLYFSELDSAQHDGPMDAPAVEAAARSLDRSLGLLVDGLDALPIRDRIYLVITSDHGMVETSAAQAIPLFEIIDMNEVERGYSGPVANLHLKDPSRAPALRDQLNAALKHGRAYIRSEVPEEFHYRASPRIGDIVVIMDEAFTAITRPSTRDGDRWGMHGWSPFLPSMHALFVVTGPGIPAGRVVQEVRNLDVYPFLTDLLGIQAAAGIEGRAGAIGGLVQDR